MANWYGSARSNYVLVDDLEGLKKAIEPFTNEITMNITDKGAIFLVESGDSGAWPTTVYIETSYKDADGEDCEGEDELQFDPAIHIAPFLKEGQVLIMQEVGAEKLRYLTGYSEAYQAKTGKSVYVSIDDIYKKAATEFGVDVNSISLAQY